LKQVVVREGESGARHSLKEVAAAGSDDLEVFPTRALDHSYWLYTSGTTGQPKGVIHLHKDLVYAVETWGKHVVDFKPEDVVYCVSRLFFSYGLNNGLYLPLYYGGAVVLSPERPLPQTVIEVVEKYRPSMLFSVPTAYGQLLNYLEEKKVTPDFSSLRACISAGEALPGPLYDRWQERFGLEALDGIGSSEVSFIYICNQPGKVRRNSSGLLLPGYQARILDEKGAPVEPGEVGDLWVKSQTLAAGYWNKPDRTAQTFVDGWMKTGDRFHQDKDGYFFYFGRADDAMKVSGIWVSPLEVEEVLLAHPAVAECAIVGHNDDMGLLKPKAFVTLKAGFEPSAELTKELQTFVKEKLAPYKYPRWIEYLDDLPKTSTGKIQRFKLRQRNS
jgi:benzoate-CoA ligase